MSFLKKRKIGKVTKIVDLVREESGLADFEVNEDGPFWHLCEMYLKYEEKKKKDHSKELLGTAKKLLSAGLSADQERIFMTLLNIARKNENHLFIFHLTLMTNDILAEGNFELNLPDSKNHIEFLSHSNLVVPNYAIDTVSDRQWKSLSEAVVKLEGLDHLHDEFLPFMATVLQKAWKITSDGPLVNSTFTKLSLGFKLKYTDEICKSGFSELNDAIVKTITLDTLMDLEEPARMKTFQTILDMGYRVHNLPFNLEKPEKYPIKDRFDIAALILEEKKKVTEQKLLNNLLSIGNESAETLYDLSIPEKILEYSQSQVGKDISKLPGFMLGNRKAIFDMIQLRQRDKITNEFFVSYIDKIPEDVKKKVSSKANTNAIMQFAIGSAMNQVLEDGDFDKAIGLVEMHGKPYGRFVNMMNDKMNEKVVSSTRDQKLHDFILDLQSKLLDIKGESGSVKVVTEWLKMLGVVKNATEGAQNDHEFAVKLLDAIEITNGEFHPITIAEQCLNLIEKDLTKDIPVRDIRATTGGGDLIAQLTEYVRRNMESRDSQQAGGWLDAIKRSYFKLRFYVKERSIPLSDEQRIRIDEISNELLSYLIMSRRGDLKKRLNTFPVEVIDIIDLGSLLRKSINNALSAFVPEAYLSFSIPAFRVLNEYLHSPERLPIVGNRDQGVIIHQNFWIFAAAISLPNLVNHLFKDAQYIDYVIPEYMKTMALALKKAEPMVRSILQPPMTVENLMIETFKGLSDHSAIQLTRDHVLEALQFSGWSTDIADKIIKEEHYCLYCSFALPENATECPNCNRAVEKIDLSEISFDDIKIDMDKIDLE